MREMGEAIATGADPARIVEQARELVDVLRGLEEWDHGPGWMRPIAMVSLNDHQVALIYSLVLLALVQKTGSTADRLGEPRYSDVRDRWLQATADDVEEVRARLAEVWGSRLVEEFGARGGVWSRWCEHHAWWPSRRVIQGSDRPDNTTPDSEREAFVAEWCVRPGAFIDCMPRASDVELRVLPAVASTASRLPTIPV